MSRKGHFTSETCLAITREKRSIWGCTYRVNGFWRNIGRVSLANELGSECHSDDELLSRMTELSSSALAGRNQCRVTSVNSN